MPGSIAAWARTLPVTATIRRAAAVMLRMNDLRSGVGGYEQRLEEDEPVLGTEQRVDGTFGMRHETDHVARRVADPGDVPHRAVRVRVDGRFPSGIDVTEQHLAPVLEPVEHILAGGEPPLAVCDGHREALSDLRRRRERRVCVFDAD